MSWETELDKAVGEYLPQLRLVAQEPMSRHTSFRIGGPAKRMAFPDSAEQLVLLVHFARECGARPLLVGNGTNLLVPDEGLDRLVIQTEGLNGLEWDRETNTLHAGAGVSLARLADFAARCGLQGLEFAHGIPGSLGGAVCMNAGAYGGEMKDVLVSASVLFPEEGVRTLDGEGLELGYRRSLLTRVPEAVVLSAALRLTPGDPDAIRARMRELMDRRREKQPLEYPSAGSTFKRPAGHFAGALIEQCGLKGFSVGGAQVSEKHAGFVINRGGATFADVTALMEQVRRTVRERTGVELEPEVRIVR
ncbi:MAG: UDP-N-acetylmuramate dehydrogenase [Oscillibacter sp.]|nr:UDP-N-acetylmuramate dehydrogenase [Oscillibacter sp.]